MDYTAKLVEAHDLASEEIRQRIELRQKENRKQAENIVENNYENLMNGLIKQVRSDPRLISYTLATGVYALHDEILTYIKEYLDEVHKTPSVEVWVQTVTSSNKNILLCARWDGPDAIH